MKFSLALSALILAVGATFDWHGRERLASVRQEYAQRVEEANLLGMDVNPSQADVKAHVTKRVREDKDAVARQVSGELIALAREMEDLETRGESPDDEMQKNIMKLIGRMMSLDAAQLKILIAEVRAAGNLKDKSRQGLLVFSIMTLASDHPQTALAIFTESSDLLESDGMGKHVVSGALANWAKDDPAAALAWVRANGGKFPDLVDEDAKRGLVRGAALNDPRLAFQWIGELGLDDQSQAIDDILSAAGTGKRRMEALNVFREYLATLPEGKARDRDALPGVGGLVRGVVSEGYAAATDWIERANLSPVELEAFAKGVHHQVKGEETGRWLEWLGTNLPAEKRDEPISSMVRAWAREDFKATGDWLNQTPEGPVRHAAVRSYAETLAEYEPEAAGQWAETLPPGKPRTETLKRIHESWPRKDDASRQAAEAFAKKHGLQ
jgi:hypothetical protein